MNLRYPASSPAAVWRASRAEACSARTAYHCLANDCSGLERANSSSAQRRNICGSLAHSPVTERAMRCSVIEERYRVGDRLIDWPEANCARMVRKYWATL